ncbi:MAG TPA: O-antigen ligase family protein [Solirubrobacteraceae bacterium]|nr:O-antigen ligase family protein [Solirubrobacteraceae bacterium]
MSTFAGLLAAKLPSAGVIAAALLGALVVVAALVALMRRRSEAFPLLAILALPFRLPISAEGRTVNLLIPLYLVVAAGTVAHLLPRLIARAEGERTRSGGQPAAAPDAPSEPRPAAEVVSLRDPASWLRPRGLELLLLAAVVLYALQSIYSADPAKAAANLAFFYIPFGLLFLLLREVRWTRELLLWCLGVAVALAVLFAGVGFVEYQRKVLFLNPKVVAANEFDNYFRVNSVFFDPNIYGRFLALVMIAVTAVALWSRRRRDVLLAAAVLAWLLAGLVTSFSQSSIAALLLGLAVLAAWRWDVRGTLYVSTGVLALGGALLLLAPASLHFGLKGSGGSTSNATSGRTKLISGGLGLFARRPLQGYGPGSFEKEYKQHNNDANAANATSASHTIPVTVAAEQGILGLGVYFALLLSAFFVLYRGAGRSPPRIAIAACFAALVLHTWTYADFLEDPMTWTLLGIGVALASPARGGREAPARPARTGCASSF